MLIKNKSRAGMIGRYIQVLKCLRQYMIIGTYRQRQGQGQIRVAILQHALCMLRYREHQILLQPLLGYCCFILRPAALVKRP